MTGPGPGRCIVCGEDPPAATLFARDGHRLVRCPRCRLVYQHPQPSDETLDATYYHDPAWTEELATNIRELTVRRAREQLLRIRDHGVAASGRALDVGCSDGSWLEVVGEYGAWATGVEIGETTAAAARERGLDVHTGTLDDALPALPDGGFDLVTFWDVLEHLRDPRHEIGLARRLLRPGGHLAASMPNVEGWYPRASRRLLAGRTGVWEYPELPVHLYDFAPRTITSVLEAAGFVDVRVRTYATPWWYYRWTSLSLQTIGRDLRGKATRIAFELLKLPLYPLARAAGRENSLFVTARRP
ncbi:MAG: class I SAM-dependent methyltransferase [Solirubrobacteraceae bacterium]|nr:class I SAM-dependent methyltransferase [Solirubrobacteraceae bacterium]